MEPASATAYHYPDPANTPLGKQGKSARAASNLVAKDTKPKGFTT
jgi:hypothetical protein